MYFSLDVRPARHGDCFLLHYGSKGAPALAIVDGGPRGVYSAALRSRLDAITCTRRGTAGPLPIDRIVVSHSDDDHIRGILDLVDDIAAAAGQPFARVSSLWHNAFGTLVGGDTSELTSALTSQFGPAAAGGELPEEITLDDAEADSETIAWSLKVLASIGQGERLAARATEIGAQINPEFDGSSIVAGSTAFALTEDLTVTVAGPHEPELKKLRAKHAQWLKEQKRGDRGATAALAAYVDRAVPNLSSVVLLVSSGGKRILLTGDARGDKILQGLEAVGALGKGQSMTVDILKVPHHGSSNDVERDFYERILADVYVFSGDGNYGNPDRVSLEMLLDARGRDPFDIHLTYPVERIDAAREADHVKQMKKVGRRPDWVHGRDSLTQLQASGRFTRSQRIVIADPTRHVIHLGESFDY